MIDVPDDPLGYELGPVPERRRLILPPPTALPIGPAPARRPPIRVRWRYALLGTYFLIAALIWSNYETPDAARARRLGRLHRDRAAAHHHAAVAARRAGRIGEAAILDDRARNHAWFADAYRGIIRNRPRWHPQPVDE